MGILISSGKDGFRKLSHEFTVALGEVRWRKALRGKK